MGKVGTKSMILLSFITQMEVYLGAAKVALDSSSSLQLAVLRLKENALNWYVAVSTRDPRMIKSWSELKEQLKKRYLPQSQDQLSLNDLLEIRYKGNIETYNNAFSDVLMLIPGLAGGDEKTEQLAMGIYAKGISTAGTSLHLASAVQTAINRKEVKTMIDLMATAQLAEQTWKMSNPGRYGNNSRKPHVAFQHGNYSNSSASSSRSAFPNRFERPQGTPNKSFNTPMKLNNINTDDDEIENDIVQQEENNVNEDENNEEPTFHEEDGDENNLFLNAIKLYEKAKKTNESLSPDEIDRRRRNGTCFRCNGQGHYANKCPQKQQKKFGQKN